MAVISIVYLKGIELYHWTTQHHNLVDVISTCLGNICIVCVILFCFVIVLLVVVMVMVVVVVMVGFSFPYIYLVV